MNFVNNFVSYIVLLVFLVNICSADESDDGFLNVTCNQASDCYVLESHGLSLACWHSVHKCKCQNTFRSDFHLEWENGKCLMSKYGPCGANGELEVGCQDGFVCVDNQCRDPTDTSLRSVKVTPYIFTESKCSEGCSIDELRLRCNFESEQCECAKIYVADARDSYWDVRSYDGNNNCSVGKFGPCGIKNGLTIDCHGNGITCINGKCLDANHLTSDVGEECASKENCKDGLLCSRSNVCIQPFSLPENKICSTDEECQKGLQCKRLHGPWSSPFCTKVTV